MVNSQTFPYQQSNASSTESSTPTFRSKQTFFRDKIKKNATTTPPPPTATNTRRTSSPSTTTSFTASRISPNANNTATMTPFGVGRRGLSSTIPASTSVLPTSSCSMTSLRSNNITHNNTSNSNSNNTYKHKQTSSTTTASTSTSAAVVPSSATPPQHASFFNINSSDKMSLVREGPEATIQQLRKELEEAIGQNSSAKTALAKSDSVILELRSSVRELKRELERKEQQELQQQQQQQQQQQSNTNTPSSNNSYKQSSDSANGEVGELQIQLDRAHAQILTADMVRKELEDTLEAEQYTWELRVQDQDRTIAMLEKDNSTLRHDLDALRSQWTEAEDGWTKDIKSLRQQLLESSSHQRQQRNTNKLEGATPRSMNGSNDGDGSFVGNHDQQQQPQQQRISTLEREKAELQVCLNEAMSELEAVDQEIRSAQGWETAREELIKENERLANLAGVPVEVGRNKRAVEFAENIDDNNQRSNHNDDSSSSVKHLVHLNQWLQQRPIEGDNKKMTPPLSLSSTNSNIPDVLVQNVKDYVEYMHLQLASSEVGIDSPEQFAELKEKIKELQEETKQEKQCNQELRESLQEAVSLLKPLQEVVDDSKKEKETLRKQLEELRQENKDQSSSSSSSKQHHSSSVSDIATRKQLQAARQDLQNREEQIQSLEDHVEKLEKQLRDEEEKQCKKMSQPSNEEDLMEQRHIESNERLHKARQELKSKRASEAARKVMLLEAQFNQLNHDKDVADMERKALHEKLRSAEEELQSSPERQIVYVTKIRKLEQEIQGYDEELKFLEKELAATKEELGKVKNQSKNPDESVEIIGRELEETKRDLKKKTEQERVLSKSLKKALHLVQPMQEFLQTAEKEKKKLARELKAANKKISHLEQQNGNASGDADGPMLPRGAASDGGESTTTSHTDQNGRVQSELERMVQELSEENQRLHKALDGASSTLNLYPDELSHFDAASHDTLKEHIMNLKRRYEVTKQRLDHSNCQQHNLLRTLREKDQHQKDVEHELRSLKHDFKKSEEELANAKYIATSALIKVEEMTMAAVQNDIEISRSHEGASDIGTMMGPVGGAPGVHCFGGPHAGFSPLNRESDTSPSANDLSKLLQKVEMLEREVADQKSLNMSLQESLRGDPSVMSGYLPSNAGHSFVSTARDPSWSPNRQHASTFNANTSKSTSLLGGDVSRSWDESFSALDSQPISPPPSHSTISSHRLRQNTNLHSDNRFLT